MERKDVQREAKLVVTRQFLRNNQPTGPEKVSDETIEVRNFQTEPARVAVDYGLTINLGNYESARIGVSITVPCYLEEANDAYTFAVDWVSERISKEKEEIRKATFRGGNRRDDL